MQFGWSYILYDITFILAASFLLVPYSFNKKGIVRLICTSVVGWLIMVTLQCVYYSVTTGQGEKIAVYFVMSILYAVFVCKYPVKVRITLTSALYAVMIVFHYCIEPIGVVIGHFIGVMWLNTFLQIVFMLFLVVMVLYLRKFAITNVELPLAYHISLISISLLGPLLVLAHVLLATAFPETTKDDYFFGTRTFEMITFMVYIAVECIAYYAFFSLASEHKQREETEILNEKLSREREYFSIVTKQYDDIRMVRHDLDNQLHYMRDLLDEERYDDLKKYFDEYGKDSFEILEKIHTGNKTIDSILNIEQTKAELRNVKMRYKIAVAPALPFDGHDLCSLITNLIDNAIEACEADKISSDEIGIEVEIRQEHNYVLFHVENAVNDESLNENRRKLITKKSVGHGYGTKIVKRVAEKYNGTCEFTLKDSRFIADAMLSLEPQEKI